MGFQTFKRRSVRMIEITKFQINYRPTKLHTPFQK